MDFFKVIIKNTNKKKIMWPMCIGHNIFQVFRKKCHETIVNQIRIILKIVIRLHYCHVFFAGKYTNISNKNHECIVIWLKCPFIFVFLKTIQQRNLNMERFQKKVPRLPYSHDSFHRKNQNIAKKNHVSRVFLIRYFIINPQSKDHHSIVS